MKKYKIVYGQKFLKCNQPKVRWISLGTFFYDENNLEECTIILDSLPIGHSHQNLILKLLPVSPYNPSDSEKPEEDRQPISNENNLIGQKWALK